MKRRDFLKYLGSGVVGAGVGIGISQVTRTPGGAKLIPYLIPPDDVVPGVANWYASLCRECSAGCGITVRVMEGRAKKIEGNPLHPVNQGGLCARGQSSLQALYNPDRIRTPLKRTGGKGSGKFEEVSWDEALSMLSDNLASLKEAKAEAGLHVLTGTLRGHLHGLIKDFMAAYGSPNYRQYELFQHTNLRRANRLTAGLGAIPHYDIANATYVLSFGADFSSTYLSPVGLSRGYGRMRQGQGERGKLVQIEPRMSLTGASADEWLPAKPGTEALVALAMANEIVRRGLYKGPGGSGEWGALLSGFSLKDAAHEAGVDEARLRRITEEFARTRRGLAMGGETIASYANGVGALAAINVLNQVAGGFGRQGGVIANPEKTLSGRTAGEAEVDIAGLIADAAGGRIKTLIVYNANPVFTTPAALKAEAAITNVPFVASLSSFMDETTRLSDLILPSHTPLEDWGDDFPEPGVGAAIATVQQPAVRPLYKTKSAGDTFLALAGALGGGTAGRLPHKEFTAYLKDSWNTLYRKESAMNSGAGGFEKFWNRLLENGGWWPEGRSKPAAVSVSARSARGHIPVAPAPFEGGAGDYPYYLILYPHTALLDGRGANLPWLQEMPDPMTSVVWDSWVEINAGTAKGLGIRHGDVVSVRSPFGQIDAPAYLHEAIRPDTVAVPIGQGHRAYGKYAEGKGVNPIEMLPAAKDPATGALALNSTRVRLERSSAPGKLGKTEGTTKELGRGIVQTISIDKFRKMKG